MAEEKHEPPPDREVQEILGDLDAILSDIGGGPGPAVPGGQPSSAPVPAPKPPAAAVPPPAAPPKPAPVLTPPPAPKPPAAPPPASPVPPKPAPAPAEPVIELGARSLPPAKPPEKKPEPPSAQPAAGKPPIEIDFGGLKPAPAAPPKPAPVLTPPPAPKPPAAPPPASPAPPKPAPAAPPPAAPAPPRPAQKGTPPPDALPAITPPDKITKEQVRRVAFIYLVKYEAERDALAKLLEQTAQTVPKKPLFMRRVLYQPVTEESGSAELLPRVQGAKAVVVIGIVEGVSEPRLRDWTEAFSSAGIKFWAVAPLEAGKKSVSIDIVVDAMLLPCEAA